MNAQDILGQLGIEPVSNSCYAGGWIQDLPGKVIDSINPANGQTIASVRLGGEAQYQQVVASALETFNRWRMVPAPARGQIVREIGEELRRYKEPLGALVTLEMGKILSEGLGEVQEMIDIADFAVGLSRQLYGNTMHSERPDHRMYEQWHPLGPIGVVTAFNFPVAVWAWNALIAAVCGDTVIWKPSLKTPLTAIACTHIAERVMKTHGFEGVFNLVMGPRQEVGAHLVNDRRIPLVSATGSCRMGRSLGAAVAGRLGRSLLELGGNNAIIVMADADLDMTLRAVLFGAVGTAGQRCTSTRRLIMHKDVADTLTQRLVAAYGSVRFGDPLESDTLVGPLVDGDAVRQFEEAIAAARAEGGEVLVGGKRLDRAGYYVEPTLVQAHKDMKIWREETFAPILYLFTVEDLEEAIAVHNDVDQGLSSAIFTRNLLHSETFLSHRGSDCGIANVNIGTSGAEIGGAFGGEKDTGGGREAGSDSWKAYMRRQTNTLNWSTELPLAQGVTFDID